MMRAGLLHYQGMLLCSKSGRLLDAMLCHTEGGQSVFRPQGLLHVSA